MARDQGIHRRGPLRLRGYDYSRSGMYFVTVCTARRARLLGDVTDGEMRLNDAGRIAQSVWADLPAHYAGLETDAFIAMPNHVHGILILHGTTNQSPLVGAGFPRPDSCLVIVGAGLKPALAGAVPPHPVVAPPSLAARRPCPRCYTVPELQVLD